MRGEHIPGSTIALGRAGSSPHARGTQNARPRKTPRTRFIPACAGNTKKYSHISYMQAVHPRMRGEHHRRAIRRVIRYGSSPHARGTLGSTWHGQRLRRFIPACAGNTWNPNAANLRASVHPRMRGEHLPCRAGVVVRAGSSPHARGTPRHRQLSPYNGRFIPACAGNTMPRLPLTVPLAVHPRMRGEHGIRRDASVGGSGSSPHARGTRFTDASGARPIRFIPACAGNTQPGYT